MVKLAEPLGTVKIIDQTIVPSADPKRLGKKDLIITYQDEALRTRVIVIPYEQLEGKSEEEQFEIIANAIRKQEKERRRFIGREIKL